MKLSESIFQLPLSECFVYYSAVYAALNTASWYAVWILADNQG